MKGIVQTIVLLVWISVPITVLAHAHLESSEPAAGAQLAESPQQVTLDFSEGIEAGFSSFSLHADGEDGPEIALDDPRTEDGSRRVILGLPETLEAGSHVVIWEVLAEDGHTTSGKLRFHVSD